MATKTTEQTKTVANKASLPGTISLTKESWAIFKHNYRILLPISLIFGVGTAISCLTQDLVQAQIITSVPTALFFVLPIDLIFFYTSVLFIFTLKNKPTRVEFIDKTILKRILPFLLVCLLYGLTVFGGIILLVIPGIIFGVWYYFANFVFLTEGLGVRASFSKSKFYVKNHFWYVFLRLFYYGFLNMIAYVLFYTIIALIVGFIMHAFGGFADFYLSLVSAIVSIPFDSLISAMGLIYGFQLYTSLKSLSPTQSAHKKSAKK